MKPLIVANWKCSPVTLKEAKQLFNSVARGIKNIKNVETVICPPFIYLPILGVSAFAKGFGGLRLGSQDCFWENPPTGGGAFTGEISPKMLKDLGVKYVIIGHSERRRHLKETDEMINKKTKAALLLGPKPILCIENLSQLKAGLRGISEKVIIAYEPVFAIGTGKPCSIVKAKKMRKSIKYPRVLYGGSVNSQNAKNYILEGGFQGLLIGGVSLNSQEFLKMIRDIEKI